MTFPQNTLPDPDIQPEFYANVPLKRLIAFGIDFVIIFGIALLITPFTAFTALWFFPFLLALISFVYRVLTLATGSATWGMRLMAIEFRTDTGARFDLPAAFMHTFAFTMCCAVTVFQIASIVLMATSRTGQGVPDMILGTTALNRRI